MSKRGLTLVMLVLAVISFMPIFWMFTLSLRTEDEAFTVLFFSQHIEWQNYLKAWHNFDMGILFKNSIIVTSSSISLTMLVGVCAAYAIAKLRFTGAKFMFFLFLSGIMIPPQGVVIPLFLFMRRIGFYGGHLSLISTYFAFGLCITIFILKSFMETIPDQLIEAARIDGCSELGILWKIVLPLCRPALATAIIFLFLRNWNEFFLAYTFLQDGSLFTLPVGIASNVTMYRSPWELIGAAVIIAGLPLFIAYLLLQKQFIEGMIAGSMKG